MYSRAHALVAGFPPVSRTACVLVTLAAMAASTTGLPIDVRQDNSQQPTPVEIQSPSLALANETLQTGGGSPISATLEIGRDSGSATPSHFGCCCGIDRQAAGNCCCAKQPSAAPRPPKNCCSRTGDRSECKDAPQPGVSFWIACTCGKGTESLFASSSDPRISPATLQFTPDEQLQSPLPMTSIHLPNLHFAPETPPPKPHAA